jgi:hypothetical protein
VDDINLSIGGCVTLISSVRSSLHLYFFSFFKALTCVIKELVRIQRNFLWGGGSESKKIVGLVGTQYVYPMIKVV